MRIGSPCLRVMQKSKRMSASDLRQASHSIWVLSVVRTGRWKRSFFFECKALWRVKSRFLSYSIFNSPLVTPQKVRLISLRRTLCTSSIVISEFAYGVCSCQLQASRREGTRSIFFRGHMYCDISPAFIGQSVRPRNRILIHV